MVPTPNPFLREQEENMRRENIFGTLEECYLASVPRTISTSYEIIAAMKHDEELRHTDFWTSQSVIYQIEKDKVTLRITDHHGDNRIFSNIHEACAQLREKRFYRTGDPPHLHNKYHPPINLEEIEFDKKSAWGVYKNISIPTHGRIPCHGQKALAKYFYGGFYGDFNIFGRHRKIHRKSFRRRKEFSVSMYTPGFIRNNINDGETIVTPVLMDELGFDLAGQYHPSDAAMQAIPRPALTLKQFQENPCGLTTSTALDYLLADEERSMREMDKEQVKGLIRLLNRYERQSEETQEMKEIMDKIDNIDFESK
jgi:hypothetical protein